MRSDHRPKCRALRFALIASLWALVVAAMGCAEIGVVPDAESPEQTALRAYSDKAARADRAREDLLASWAALSKAPTAEALQRAVQRDMHPKLRGYRAALDMIQPRLPALEAVHDGLADAYRKLDTEVLAWAGRLRGTDPLAARAELETVLAAVRAAEVRYRADLQLLYANHGFKLRPRPVAASGAADQPGKGAGGP